MTLHHLSKEEKALRRQQQIKDWHKNNRAAFYAIQKRYRAKKREIAKLYKDNLLEFGILSEIAF